MVRGMRRPTFAAVTAAAVLCLSTIALAPSADAAPGRSGPHRNVHVCASPAKGSAGCDAIRSDPVAASGQATPMASTPSGYGPADIQSAYALTGLTSGKKTVAIVDAYNAPNAEADLGVYRSHFGLPACTTANGCFRKVNQTGGTGSLPHTDGGWAQEISLDLDMVSAACPDCKILLVEAKTSSFANLAAAVNTAAKLGAAAISNSYGGGDTTSYASSYNHPGIAITASTGDNGYAISAPASLPGVVAVGGTSLTRDSSTRGWNEAAWSGAGSGCSTVNAKPSYQTSATQCAGKATADVSAVADPNTGVAVYDSYAYQGYSGWMQFGGTSASSPIIAGVYALGTAATGSYPAAYTWGHAGQLNDVTTGSNGTCTTTVWCTSGSGWDGPTGLGTPNGAGAF
jgi:subtilase family serine protease